MVRPGKFIRLSFLCKINCADPGFHLCFQFFRSVVLNKGKKDVSTPLPSVSATCGFGHG